MMYKCDKCEREMCYPRTFISQPSGEKHLCPKCTEDFNEWLKPSVEEEYSLTFEEALREMLDGNVIQSKENMYRFSRQKSYIEQFDDGEWEQTTGFYISEQMGKWKVVK